MRLQFQLLLLNTVPWLSGESPRAVWLCYHFCIWLLFFLCQERINTHYTQCLAQNTCFQEVVVRIPTVPNCLNTSREFHFSLRGSSSSLPSTWHMFAACRALSVQAKLVWSTTTNFCTMIIDFCHPSFCREVV